MFHILECFSKLFCKFIKIQNPIDINVYFVLNKIINNKIKMESLYTQYTRMVVHTLNDTIKI